MITRFLVVLLLAQLLGAGPLLAATLEATTSDGRIVILNPDGTWKFKKQEVSAEGHRNLVKPAGSTKVITSKKGFCELWYNPETWTAQFGSKTDVAEFKLAHSSGDAYAMAIVERIQMPLASLRKIALDNAKASAPDAKITLEEERTVNGVKFLVLQIEGTIEGTPFKYYGYYWSGKAGTLQVITYTGQNIFDEMAKDFTTLLNGLVITKK